MEIVKNELYKIFGNIVFDIALIGFFLLNGILFWHQIYEKPSYKPSEYAMLYQNLENLNIQDAYDKICSLCNTAVAKCHYTNSKKAEEVLYQDVRNEIADCISYKEYLHNIKEAASDLSSISVFTENHSYDTRNNKKTIKDFNALMDHELLIGVSKGISQLSDFLLSDCIIIFLIFIMAGILVMEEKEAGVKNLLRTSCHGHEALGAAKLAAMLIGSLLAEILIYGSNYFLAGQSYGFGNLNRYIQSVYGYRGSSLNITAGQYLLFFFATKFLVYSTVSAVLYFFSIMSKSAVQFIIYSGIFIVINVYFYTNIDGAGYLSILKYSNLAAYINTKILFSKYLNFNILGYPVHYMIIFFFANGCIIFLCSILGIWKFSRKESGIVPVRNIKRKLPEFLNFKTYQSTNLLIHESYKIFISGKVLFIMILLILFLYVTYIPVGQRSTGKDIPYYRQYALKYEGTVNQEKERAIEKERNYYEAEYEKKSSSTDVISEEKSEQLQVITDHLSAISLVEGQMEYLEKHEKGWILYDTGYQFLTGGSRSGQADVTQGLLAVFMVICCLTCVFSTEYENRMTLLLHTVYKGKKETIIIKLFLSAIILVMIYAAIYGSYFFDVFSNYGTSALNAPANSLQHLSRIPDSISVFQYLIFVCILRFWGMLMEGICIFFLSCKTKSFIKTMLAAIGLFVLPIVFNLIGISFFKYFLLTPLIKGNIL